MPQDERTNRKEIFSFRDEQRDFDDAVSDLIRGLIEQKRDAVMSPDNTISYSHGKEWIAWQQDEEEPTHSFKEHRHEESIGFQDILDHKLAILPHFILRMVDGLHSDFMKSVYQLIHESTDKTGNVVDAKEHSSQAEAFLAMLRKIEFGVARDGSISRPQIHLPPDAHKKFVQDLEAEGEEFKRIVEEITADKEVAALQKEAKRKARFVQSTDQS